MLGLLLTHLVASIGAPLVVRAMGTKAFAVLSVPCVATAAWAIAHTGAATSAPPREHYPWVPALDLGLDLRMDSLSWVLTLIVSVIGALILWFCIGYFDDDEPDLERFAAHLTGFAGVMAGLVWSDNLLLLYLFWELTTVLSYLLVGHSSQRRESRQSATQALVVTTFGGLAMLVGLILVGQAAGTYRLSDLIAHPPAQTLVTASGIVFILLGAITKSALIPFHFWLPGAMAAPTPVSAYLHAAAMVKAGIYLVARFAPGFAGYGVWLPVVVVLGGATMLIGGYRSLRQHDLKLLLAYGTVSQLGFLTVLTGLGTTNGALAGVCMLVTHALFKAGLFLTVGAIDHATGSRDIRQLHRLGLGMPVLAIASILCAASMAGVPPLLGFVGKEAAYATLLHGETWWSLPALAVVVAGSVLTFAYSARFCWGAWGPCPGAGEPTHPHRNPITVTGPPVMFAAASLVAAPLSPGLEPLVAPWVTSHRKAAYAAHLGLWHGWNLAVVLSILTMAAGVALFAARKPVERFQAAAPHPVAAVSGYRFGMRTLDRLSLEVTGFVHRGSLPLTLSLILVVFVALPGGAMVAGRPWQHPQRWWDTPAQTAVAIIAVIAAVGAVRSRRRLRAVLLVGATGYCCAMEFLLHGAPDLALTQMLVETLSIVVFVLVVRRLTGRFRDDRNRAWRILFGVCAGAVVTGAAMVASLGRTFAPDSADMGQGAVEFGGGYNIVNVILVDIRAWDTMGEISVVLVAATGVASLVFLRSKNVSAVRERLATMRTRRGKHRRSWVAPDTGWLPEIAKARQERRSLIFEVVVRLIFHAIMVWSLYLLLTGHNDPGGGFAGGLVAGLGLTVSYLVGGARELRATLPIMPGVLLGTGLFLSAGFGLVSMLAGGDVLQSWTFDVPVPLIGNIHLVTSVFFDIGVYLLVIGLVLDVLRSLGSTLDQQIAASRGEPIEGDTTTDMPAIDPGGAR